MFKRIRELIGQPAEAIHKARLYDELMKSADPFQARKTIPILVKYTRLMNGLFEDIQKLVPPGGTPRRVLYQGTPGSSTGTLYEAVGEVEVVHNPPTAVESEEGSRSGRLENRRRGPALLNRGGRVPGQRGPDGVSHLSAGLPTDLGHRIGPARRSDGTHPAEKRLPEKGSPEHESLLPRSA